jgi:hypothetical protein
MNRASIAGNLPLLVALCSTAIWADVTDGSEGENLSSQFDVRPGPEQPASIDAIDWVRTRRFREQSRGNCGEAA